MIFKTYIIVETGPWTGALGRPLTDPRRYNESVVRRLAYNENPRFNGHRLVRQVELKT